MARMKKPVHKVVMTEGKRQIIANLLSEYDIKSANDIQSLKRPVRWYHQRNDGNRNGCSFRLQQIRAFR